MILKKLITGFIFLAFLNGCAQNAALLGPAYTLSQSGNVYHTAISYGSNKAITNFTGKSTGENIQNFLLPNPEDSDFEKLVKKRILETRKKLNLSNQ
tara:strand:+ start:225 stop:515 length:291 start_codon:yes stop_codon:yes gene_type:complete